MIKNMSIWMIFVSATRTMKNPSIESVIARGSYVSITYISLDNVLMIYP